MDSSTTSIHHFILLQIHHLALQHYDPGTLPAFPLDAHYRLEKLTLLTYPHQLPLMYGLSHHYSLQYRQG